MAFAETLAVYHRKRCLLVDADGQMSLSLMMADGRVLANNQQNGHSLVTLFSRAVVDGQSVDWREYVLSNISDVDDAKDLHLIQGDMDLPLLEREISSCGRTDSLRTTARWLIDEFEQYFDFIFVDCAPGISVITETWLRECDYQIIPTKADSLAFTALEYLRPAVVHTLRDTFLTA
jgi:chromosome partitioning protein